MHQDLRIWRNLLNLWFSKWHRALTPVPPLVPLRGRRISKATYLQWGRRSRILKHMHVGRHRSVRLCCLNRSLRRSRSLRHSTFTVHFQSIDVCSIHRGSPHNEIGSYWKLEKHTAKKKQNLKKGSKNNATALMKFAQNFGACDSQDHPDVSAAVKAVGSNQNGLKNCR